MTSADDTLHRDLDDYIRARLRGLWIRVALLVVLILFLAINVALLLAEFRRWDARFVVTLAGQQLEQALPDARQQLETFIVDSAPGLLDVAEQHLLAEPARQRARAETVVAEYARDRLATYRKDLDDLLDRSIDQGLADLEKVDPDAATAQQLDGILDGIVGGIERDWADFLSTVGQAYRHDLDDYNDYMRSLASDGKLERKKRIERDLIRATIALHDRAAAAADGPE